jgi:hypothetical protein
MMVVVVVVVMLMGNGGGGGGGGGGRGRGRGGGGVVVAAPGVGCQNLTTKISVGREEKYKVGVSGLYTTDSYQLRSAVHVNLSSSYL